MASPPANYRSIAEHKFKSWKEVVARKILPGYGGRHGHNKKRAWAEAKRKRASLFDQMDLEIEDLTSLLEELPEYFQTECKLYRLLSRAIEDQRTADMNGHSWTSHPDQPSVSGDFLQCGGGLYQAVECPFLMSEDQDLHAWVRKDEQYKLGDLLAEVWFEPRVENPPVVQSDPDDGVEETSTGPDQESAISKDTTKGIDDRVYWEKWCLEKQVEYLLYLENIYLVDASAAFLDLGFTAAAAGRSHTLEMKTGVFQWDKNWLQGWQ